MNRSNFQIIDLIRFLDRTLDPERDASLREQLADDQQLRQKLAIVQAAFAKDVADEINLENDGLFDDFLEQLSRYLDGQLAANEIDHFEQLVLSRSDLLLELISANRFSQSYVSAQPALPEGVSRAFDAVFSEQLPLSDAKEATTPEPVMRKVNGTAKKKSQTVSSASKKRPNKRQNIRRAAVKNKPKFHVSARVIATAGVALLMLVAAFWMKNQSAPQTPDFAENEPPSTNDSQSPPGFNSSTTPDLPQRENSPEKFPLVQGEPVLPTPDKEMNRSEVVVVESPAEPKLPPVIPPTKEWKTVALDWQQTIGLLVAKTEKDSVWQEVHSLTAEQALKNTGTIEYRSLQESWGVALAHGMKFTMGAETTTRLKVEEATGTRITLDQVQGNFAISALPEGTEVFYQQAERETLLKILEPNTAIAFDSNVDMGEVIVIDGAISVGTFIIKAAHKFSLTSIRFTAPEQHRQRPRWLASPSQSQAIVRSMGQSLENDSDVLTALLDGGRKRSNKESQVAIAWSFELNPVQAVPLAAISTNRFQRESAIQWLLASKTDTQTQRAVWGNISGRMGKSSLHVSNWYLVMRNKTPPTIKLLTELSQGIGKNQPLFVRESSISLLRVISKQSYSTYNSENPSAKAINSVRLSIRKMATRLKKSPQRNTPQRNPGRGS